MTPTQVAVRARPRLDMTLAWRGLAVAAFVAAALAFPRYANNYYIHIANYSLIYLFPALGLNLIFGYTGLLSLAQGAFFGIGAYVAALLAIHLHLPFWLTFLCGGLFCAALSLPLAVPALRLRAYSFVMCTLSFVFIAEMVAKNWVSLTRGDMALTGVARPMLSLWGDGQVIMRLGDYYYLLLTLACAGAGLFWWIIASPAGRCFRAVRDEEVLAQAVGVPALAYKLAAFALSAFYAGLGGAAYAHYETVVSPQIFQIYFTLLFLVIVFAGGAGTFSGILIGTFLFVAIPEALRVTPDLRMILYGVIFLVLVFWLPQGVGPALAGLARRLRPARR